MEIDRIIHRIRMARWEGSPFPVRIWNREYFLIDMAPHIAYGKAKGEEVKGREK